MCAMRPNLGVVFTTGHTSDTETLSSLVAQGALVLQKPYNSAILTQTIRSVLDKESAHHNLK
jgi:hypothetical protein